MNRLSLAVSPTQHAEPTAAASNPGQHLPQQPAATDAMIFHSNAVTPTQNPQVDPKISRASQGQAPALGDSTEAMQCMQGQQDTARTIELAVSAPMRPLAGQLVGATATNRIASLRTTASDANGPLQFAVNGRPREIAVPQTGRTSTQPDDTLVDDLRDYLARIDKSSEWTYKGQYLCFSFNWAGDLLKV